MKQIKGGETPDKGFGFIENGVPVRTLKFDLKSAFCWVKLVALSAREGE